MPGKFGHFIIERMLPLHEAIRQAGVFGGSGQEATLLVQCALYGFRAGAILVGQGENQNSELQLADEAIRVSLETMRLLWQWDQLKL
jgi:hypothetical protein